MKKTLFVSLILCCAAFGLRAQNTSTTTSEIVNNVVQQSQDAAEQAKQAETEDAAE